VVLPPGVAVVPVGEQLIEEDRAVAPSRAALAALLEQAGIRLDERAVDRLWAYHGMLRAANAELNLTRIHAFEAMVRKHYVDCLVVLRYGELPSPLVDMGSGAGLPGIPLAIARPGTAFVLAETRANRTAFLESVVERLGLSNVEVHTGSVGPKFQRTVGGVITRAVADIPETLRRVAHVLEPGGRVLLMKGPDCDGEVAAAVRTFGDDFRLAADHAYVLPDSDDRRRLVVFEKVGVDVEAGGSGSPALPAPGRPAEIRSASNAIYRMALDLRTGRGIRKHGRALVSGSKVVPEVLARHGDAVEAWITGPGGPEPPRALPWLRMEAALYREVDVAGTGGPVLLVRVPAFAAWSDQAPWPEGCTLFVPFQDPENVGAVVRTAAAFGVSRVVLLREAAHPFHPKAARAAGTALLQVRFEAGPPVAELRVTEAPLVALAGDGVELAGLAWPERFGLVVGVEGPGLPEGLRRDEAVTRVRIPIAAEVESLNAAASAAVALYAWRTAGGDGAGR
jgi:16S rRNA (guanine527-N7)-methyltransferase